MANYPKETLSSLEVLSHVLVISTKGRNLLLTAGFATKISHFDRNDSEIGLYTKPSVLGLKSPNVALFPTTVLVFPLFSTLNSK